MAFWERKKQNNQVQQKKKLIIITGCAGAGKTTIGTALAKNIKYTYIDKDTVTREFTDYLLIKLGSFEGDRESEQYTNDILPMEYRTTFKLCREILENGSNVVLTIPFISQIRDIKKWEEIKKDVKIKDDIDVKFIWIKHNIDTEKKSIINRGAKRDQYKIEHWDWYADSVEGIEPDEKYGAYLFVNDYDVNLNDSLEEIIKWINQ